MIFLFSDKWTKAWNRVKLLAKTVNCSILYKLHEAGTKVLASQLFLDCWARRSGWVGSTTLISSAFTALLNCAEVGRRNRILTNYRFLSHSLVFNQPFLPLAVGHVLIHKWYPHRSGWSGHGSPWWRSCFWIWLLSGSTGRFLALDLGLG